MSNESPKRMERMLRRWARQRRDAAGSGWAVHPATRGMLQGEVARTFGTARGKAKKRDGARGWWWGLVWGGGAVAAVALVLAVWGPRSGGRVAEMADNGLAAVRTNPDGGAGAVRLADENERLRSMVASGNPEPTLAEAQILESKDRAGRASSVAGAEKAGAALPGGGEPGVALAKRMSDLGRDARLDGVAAVASPNRALMPTGERSRGELAVGNVYRDEAVGVVAGAKLGQGSSGGLAAVNGAADAIKRESEVSAKVVPPMAPVSRTVGVVAATAARAQQSGVTGLAVGGGSGGLREAKVPELLERAQSAKGVEADDFGAAAGNKTRAMVRSLSPSAPPAPVSAVPMAAGPASRTEDLPAIGFAGSGLKLQSGASSAPVQGPGQAQQDFLRMNAPGAYRRNLQSPPVPAVLNRFQLQRAGEVVTVVDEDGSVYMGQVLARADASRGAAVGEAHALRVVDALPEKRKAAEVKGDAQLLNESGERRSKEEAKAMPQAGERFVFQASGTNRSLNELVVFTGEFVPVGAGDKDLGAKVVSARAWFFDGTNGAGAGVGRIQGRARVGRDDIRVEALQQR